MFEESAGSRPGGGAPCLPVRGGKGVGGSGGAIQRIIQVDRSGETDDSIKPGSLVTKSVLGGVYADRL